MDSKETAIAVVAAALPVLLAVLGLWWFRRRRRDEIFEGVTPGELPALGQQVTRGRVPRGKQEYGGPVAVRFTPPDGLTPGLVGTVIDGQAHVIDVSATLIDLAVRGYLHLHAEPADPNAPRPPERGPQPKTPAPQSDHDWRLTRLAAPDGAPALLPFEQKLLDAVFRHGPETTIRELKARGFDLTMREAQVGLYREVVDRGWYTKHPRDRNRRLGCLGWILVLLAAGAAVAGVVADPWAPGRIPLIALGGGLLVAAIALIWGGRGRTPRTAEGTAARIQALGFREYLTKAEANQIRFEEARDLFSRYLPFAMVFGVADRWAKTFAEVAQNAHAAGLADVYFDLTWIDGFNALGSVLGDLWQATEILDAFGAGFDFPDLDLADGLSGIADGVGDFADSASGLLDFGDGCSGCDGCDLGI